MNFIGGIIKSFIERFLTKQSIIGFAAAILIAAVAVPLGMSSVELKNAICSAPQVTIEKPKADVQLPAQVPDVGK